MEGSGKNMISYYDFYFLRSSIGVNQFCLADVLRQGSMRSIARSYIDWMIHNGAGVDFNDAL